MRDEPSNPEKLSVVELVAFLDGRAPIDGLWFGDHDPRAGAFWWRKHLTALLSLQERLDKLEAENRHLRSRALPRLSDEMIEAALFGHYGKKTLGIDALDLTAGGVNWSFRQGFRRMWNSVNRHIKARSALSPQTREGDK